MVTNEDVLAPEAADIIDLPALTAEPSVVLGKTANEEADSFRLPFSFASAQGVMLADAESKVVLHRPGLTLDVLLELQRYLGDGFTLQEIAADDFQKRLTKDYQSGDGAAQRAVDDLGAEFDLSSMAEDLAERTDLLAGDDDAPIIRLINAILSQAVREGASDIHLEPFEDRVSVRFRIDGVLNEVLSPKPE